MEQNRMYLDNIALYLADASEVTHDKKWYREHGVLWVLFYFLCGIIPGIILNGFWLPLSLTIEITLLSSAIALHIISGKTLTLKRRLILDVIITTSYLLVFLFLKLLFLAYENGLSFLLFFFFIPEILIPIFIGIRTYRQLKSSEYTSKPKGKKRASTIAVSVGVFIGMVTAPRLFENMEQQTVQTVLLLGLCGLTALMSAKLVSLQKLYFVQKYYPSESME